MFSPHFNRFSLNTWCWAGGGKKDLEAEEQRSKPPESPRREGKRREDEDYFVVEVKVKTFLTEKDQDFPGAGASALRGF